MLIAQFRQRVKTGRGSRTCGFELFAAHGSRAVDYNHEADGGNIVCGKDGQHLLIQRSLHIRHIVSVRGAVRVGTADGKQRAAVIFNIFVEIFHHYGHFHPVPFLFGEVGIFGQVGKIRIGNIV